jgi:hypothetical protein
MTLRIDHESQDTYTEDVRWSRDGGDNQVGEVSL